MIKLRRSTDAIAVSSDSAACTATSGQCGDGSGCYGNNANEVVKRVGDKYAAHVVDGDARRSIKVGIPRANAVGVSGGASSRKRRHSTRASVYDTNGVISLVCNIDKTGRAVDGNIRRTAELRIAPDAIDQ